jgi:hypothetical protein
MITTRKDGMKVGDLQDKPVHGKTNSISYSIVFRPNQAEQISDAASKMLKEVLRSRNFNSDVTVKISSGKRTLSSTENEVIVATEASLINGPSPITAGYMQLLRSIAKKLDNKYSA